MIKFSESFANSVKSKIFGATKNNPVKEQERNNPEKVSDKLKIISKNFLAIGIIARDINISSKSVSKLVRLMGGKPSASSEDKSFFKTEDEKEARQEKQKQAEAPSKDSSLMNVGKFLLDFFKKVKDGFTPLAIIAAVVAALAETIYDMIALFTFLFSAIVDNVTEWASNLWETIKEKFDEFVTQIKEWFTDIVKPIYDAVKESFNKFVNKIFDFFRPLFEWIMEKFTMIKDFSNQF